MQDGLGFDTWEVPLTAPSYEILMPPHGSDRHHGSRTSDGSPVLAPVILCDHAGNSFPEGYGTLGLPHVEIERHIAYDIGAAGVVRRMLDELHAAAFPVTAVLSRYSRLLIDLNRGPDDPTLIMRLSDGAVVPGNHPIDAAEWSKRIALYYEPYHRAIDSVVDELLRQGLTPVIVSVHSFTHVWKGEPRPWHAGILWDSDARLPSRMLAALRADPNLEVGDNQPYSGQLDGDCLHRHATRLGLANALVEIRQDLISSSTGQQAWASRLTKILVAMFADRQAAEDLQQLPVSSHIGNMR